MVLTISGKAYTDSELERLSRQTECSVSEFAALQAWAKLRIKQNGGERQDSE
jgi:hypothetical protein